MKFNPDEFEAYINRLSEEDKLKAKDIIESKIPKDVLIADELKKLWDNDRKETK